MDGLVIRIFDGERRTDQRSVAAATKSVNPIDSSIQHGFKDQDDKEVGSIRSRYLEKGANNSFEYD